MPDKLLLPAWRDITEFPTTVPTTLWEQNDHTRRALSWVEIYSRSIYMQVMLKVVGNEKEGGRKGAKRSQYVSDQGDWCSFLSLFCCRLLFYVFPFPPQ